MSHETVTGGDNAHAAGQAGPHSADRTVRDPGPEGVNASGRTRAGACARESNDRSAHPQPGLAAQSAATEGDGNGAAGGPPVSFGKTPGPADTETPADADADADASARWAELARMWSGRASAAAATLTPPDMWSTDRPSLSAMWAYADRAEWTTPDGTVRWAGRAYCWVAIAVTSLLYGVAWVVERPSRLAVAALLLTLAGQVPPLSWLI